MAAFLALAGPAAVAYQGEGVPLKTQPEKPDFLGNHVLMLVPNDGPATQLVGAPVYDRNNDRVGTVAYVLLAPPGTDVAAVVISVPMFLYSKHVAVRSSDFVRENNRLIVDQTKRDLQRTVAFRP
jgi:hypothetical protein